MKTKTFTVNGTAYPVKEIDFNFLCDMEDRGITVDDIDKKPMKILREYLSIVGGMTSVEAGKEIEAHVVSGKSLTEAYGALNDAMESSGFFRAMSEQSVEEESPETVGENTKTKRQAK